MLILAAVILGALALNKMRVEQNPDVSFPAVTISTVYPGAGPEEVETLVTKKLEDAVSSVSNLREITSTSQEGISFVSLSFEIGTDNEVAFNDTRAKIDAIRSNLPEQALSPTVQKFETSSEPVLYLSMSSTRPSVELRDLADNVLKDRFSRIKGVGSVAIAGGDEREILVSVDRAKLAAYGVGIARVWNSIRNATANVPAGRAIEGAREYTVRLFGEFRSVAELRGLKIPLQSRENPNLKGPTVRLADIATVEDTTKERTTYTRLNERESIALIFVKTTQGNAVEISKAAHEEIARVAQEYPDIKFTTISDSATHVSESLADLKSSLFIGIGLVVLIIFLFLHNLRGTIIVATAIPVCIFATFTIINAVGFTLNSMTMLGLSLAVGILVDDAIVVLENIYRHLTRGEDPKTAAINGRMEIGLAAIVITAVDVVVFLPIGTMGGIVGQFFRPFGLTVATATLLSLFVSFTITPMLAARWYRKNEDLEHPKGVFAALEAIWQVAVSLYRAALAKALHHRWLTVFLGFGILVSVFMLIFGSFTPLQMSGQAALGASKNMFIVGAVLVVIWALRRRVEWLRAGMLFGMLGVMFAASLLLGSVLGDQKGQPLFQFRFAPNSDQATVNVNLIFPAGTALEATEREVRRIEDIAMKTRDVEHVFTSIGSTSAGFFGSGDTGSQFAQVRVTLNDKRTLGEALLGKSDPKLRLRKDTDVADELRGTIGKVPGAVMSISAVSGFGFGQPIMISLTGRDPRLLDETAARVRAAIAGIPGIIDTDISSKPGKPETRAMVDRERMADADVTVADLGAAMRIAYEGDDTVKYREGGREYPIRVRMRESDRNNVAGVANVPVAFTNGGAMIALADLAKPVQAFGPTKITRRDKMREVLVTGGLLPGFNPGSMQPVVDAELEKLNVIPAGVTKKWQGENDVQAREFPFMMSALMLSFILVYMLMASLFDNLLYPLIIMLAQPQALAGALLALIITNTAFDIVGFIGIIMLVGLVGKNAILLVDYTNTLRARGMNRLEALKESGPTRLRPIAMTTLAMVLAMLPIALALGRGSEFRASLGIIVIGGLILSTLLTLLVIPCTYTIIDDMSMWLSQRVLRRRAAAQPSPEAIPVPASGE